MDVTSIKFKITLISIQNINTKEKNIFEGFSFTHYFPNITNIQKKISNKKINNVFRRREKKIVKIPQSIAFLGVLI